MNFIKSRLTVTLMIIISSINTSGAVNIVPAPASMISGKGYFRLTPKISIITNTGNKAVKDIAGLINRHLTEFYNFSALPIENGSTEKNGSIIINLDENYSTNPEGYKLTVTKNYIEICSSAPNGIFYGIQTLFQMMPPEKKEISKIKIKCAKIEDYPRFSWRGLHLDVCRHFMPKEFILKYLDYMAMHKLNTFHFHLTDDQGWRIEIKKYPLLTQIGAVRSETLVGRYSKDNAVYDGTPYSGFYTQEDIKEIVKYAAERYITVVPEIEMPGHALAALSAYPELGCTGGPYKSATKWGVFDDVMCAGKESTFKFLEGVLEVIISLFPSSYIHVGGDECPKVRWHDCPLCQQRMKDESLADEHQLQSYFIQRIEKFINGKGRKLIGWDEILEGGLAPNAAVMSWRGEEGGISAAGQQHFVVMTPGSHCYLDHYQGDKETEPLAIGGYTPLEKIYGYEPVPAALSAENARFVMGAQGNVWTEYMASTAHVEYMVYPRAAALSEVLWSPKESRDYPSFMKRMKTMVKRYKNIGLNYCPNEFSKSKKKHD